MIGIDTIHLRIPMSISPGQFKGRWAHSIFDEGKENENQSWRYQSHFHPELNLQYFERAYNSESSMIIKISSLARLAFGDNFTPFQSLAEAISVLSACVMDDPFIPMLGDISKALLARVDFFIDNPIGEDGIIKVLNYLSRCEYPRRSRDIYCNSSNHKRTIPGNNGVAFFNASVMSRFYDKHLQCQVPDTKGLLRHEIQLSTGRECSRIFDPDEATFSSISEDIVERLFYKDLRLLHLEDAVSEVNQAEAPLVEMYGRSRATHLLDLLRFRQDHLDLTVAQIAVLRGVRRDYLRRQFHEIEKAGVSPVLVIEKLPVLRTTPLQTQNRSLVPVILEISRGIP